MVLVLLGLCLLCKKKFPGPVKKAKCVPKTLRQWMILERNGIL